MALDAPPAGWGPLIDRSLGPAGAPAPWALTVSRYLDELLVWNRKTDLTAARTPEELVDLTLADALVIARASAVPPDGSGAWIDVGSGAGAPGLVLAWMMPDLRFTLVEPRDRRVAFLRSAIGKFGLPGTRVERGRSDRLPAGEWHSAVSRATLPPPAWLREGARLARSAIWVLLAREDPPHLPGLGVDQDIRYEWPLTAAPRRAVRYVRTPG